MRLRTYLVKRAVHTVITLLVVLVLLFVLFRLMPGDPTRFFIRPGQTQADREQILVDFGFAHWCPVPGHGFRAFFQAEKAGTYVITVTATAADGSTLQLYANYTQDKPDFGKYDVSNALVREGGSTDVSRFSPGDSLTLVVEAQKDEDWGTVYANATVTPLTNPGAPTTLPPLTGTPGQQKDTYTGTFGTDGFAVGTYDVLINLTDADNPSNTTLSHASFALNPSSIAPFSYPDNSRLVAEGRRGNSVEVTANLTHGAGIRSVTLDVVAPTGEVVRNAHPMSHPQTACRNNPIEEFFVYMRNMLVLDFGDSFYTRQPVWSEIEKRIGPTMLLFGSSLVIGALVGVGIGAIMAWRRGSRLELGTVVVTLFFHNMPVFWMGLVLLFVFSYTLEWFPLGGFGGFDPLTGERYEGLQYVADVLSHLALPLFNLVLLGLAGSILLMRNSMLEVMGEDYIMTARAKGLSERTVMYKHAARNAMLPVVTTLALSIGGVISGGVLTETIFTWPGMGYFLVTATLTQDFPAVQGAFFLLALITIFSNMVADVMYAFLDPRVRL